MKKTPQHSIRWLALILLALIAGSPLLSACSSLQLVQAAKQDPTPTVAVVQADPTIVAEGHIVPNDSSQLSFQTGGKVSQVLVKEGDEVKQGDVLVSLGDREQLEAAITAANLEQLQAQQALDDLNKKSDLARTQTEQALSVAEKASVDAAQKLDDLDTQDFQDELDDLWVSVTDAQDDLDDAKDELDKYQDLDKDNPTRTDAEDALDDAQTTYDNALREYDLKKNELTQAKADLAQAQANEADLRRQAEARQDGPDPDELALSNSRLANAQAQLAAAQKALENMDLVAPYDGTIVEVNVTSGEEVAPGVPVLLFADFSKWYVDTSDLTELDVVKIDPSKDVTIIPDAMPDLSLTGSVESISRTFKEKGPDITYTVRILLDKIDPALRWGMTVEAHFEE